MAANFKVGSKVHFTRRNGDRAHGVVSGIAIPGPKGSFIPVNTGDKKAPLISKVRPSQLSLT